MGCTVRSGASPEKGQPGRLFGKETKNDTSVRKPVAYHVSESHSSLLQKPYLSQKTRPNWYNLFQEDNPEADNHTLAK